jgi:hypothetical protein
VPSFTVNDNLTYVAPYTFLYRKWCICFSLFFLLSVSLFPSLSPSLSPLISTPPSFSLSPLPNSFVHLPPLTYLLSLNLTGWPTIGPEYDFSLEIFEPASNYNRLQCEAESFPSIKAFAWTRDDTVIDSRFPRYNFTNTLTNVTTGNPTTSFKISTTITISEIMFEDSAYFACNIDNLGGLLKTDVSHGVRLRVKREWIVVDPCCPFNLVVIMIIITVSVSIYM